MTDSPSFADSGLEVASVQIDRRQMNRRMARASDSAIPCRHHSQRILKRATLNQLKLCPIVRPSAINAKSVVIENRLVHRHTFEYGYECRFTEYEYERMREPTRLTPRTSRFSGRRGLIFQWSMLHNAIAADRSRQRPMGSHRYSVSICSYSSCVPIQNQ